MKSIPDVTKRLQLKFPHSFFLCATTPLSLFPAVLTPYLLLMWVFTVNIVVLQRPVSKHIKKIPCKNIFWVSQFAKLIYTNSKSSAALISTTTKHNFSSWKWNWEYTCSCLFSVVVPWSVRVWGCVFSSFCGTGFPHRKRSTWPLSLSPNYCGNRTSSWDLSVCKDEQRWKQL